jgi:PhnB protein
MTLENAATKNKTFAHRHRPGLSKGKMMDKAIKASDYGTVAVSLVVKDAKAAIDFYKTAFGAKHLYSLTMPNGGIAHAEFKIGGTLVMIADENPEWHNKSPQSLGGTPVTLNVMVENPDATVAKAEKAGAKVIFPVEDHFYGFRSGRIQDPFGHMWIVSKVNEELTPKEMQKRMNAMMAEAQAAASAKKPAPQGKPAKKAAK